MSALADDLYRSLKARIHDLEELLDQLVGQLSESREGLRYALRLLQQYPAALTKLADVYWNDAQEDVDRIDQMRMLLHDIRTTSSLVEEWFARGAAEWISLSLVRAVEAECDRLLGDQPQPRHVVLAIGSADNFRTYIYDLRQVVFKVFEGRPASLHTDLDTAKFMMLQIPRVEASHALWRPLILGHELAHLAVHERMTINQFDLHNRMDAEVLASFDPPDPMPGFGMPPPQVPEVAQCWVEELLCDAYMLRRFGPASVAVLCSFLELVGHVDLISAHPPGAFRAKMMLRWLDGMVRDDTEATLGPFASVLRPWRELAASPVPPDCPDWARYLMDLLHDAADEFPRMISSWPAAYDFAGRSATVQWIVGQLKEGIAPAECIEKRGDDGYLSLVDADVINAGWIARADESRMPIDKLVEKSLESLDFLRRWHCAGGKPPEIPDAADGAMAVPIEAAPTASVLTAPTMFARLSASGPDRLVVTPRLPGSIGGAAMDVRLGKHFIVFVPSSMSSFDPLKPRQDPRTLQLAVEKDWGEVFVLHPDELVLASTLEYFAIPSDLTGQVITRSSYGRLGLITATAVLVQPSYRGCLTLELKNHGEIPIALTPGERIAQLSFQHASPSVGSGQDRRASTPTPRGRNSQSCAWIPTPRSCAPSARPLAGGAVAFPRRMTSREDGRRRAEVRAGGSSSRCGRGRAR